MLSTLNHNSAYLISGYLNNEDITSAIFNGLSYPKGKLGQLISLNNVDAARMSYATTGTLYAGIYQLVLFKSGSSAANIRGGALCWQDRSTFTVTPDQTAPTEEDFAGVGLMVNTKGNYGWMQVAGDCSIKYRASVTGATLGNLVFQLTTTNTFDAYDDTAGTLVAGGVKGIKNVVGVANVLPVNDTVVRASIWARNLNFG
jgi:hypothetical protein